MFGFVCIFEKVEGDMSNFYLSVLCLCLCHCFLNSTYAHWDYDINNHDDTRKHNLEPYTSMSDFLKNGADKYCGNYYEKHRPKQEGCIISYTKRLTDEPIEQLYDLYNGLSKNVTDLYKMLEERLQSIGTTSNPAVASTKKVIQNATQSAVNNMSSLASESIDSRSDSELTDWLYPVLGCALGVVFGISVVVAYKKGYFGRALAYFSRKQTQAYNSSLHTTEAQILPSTSQDTCEVYFVPNDSGSSAQCANTEGHQYEELQLKDVACNFDGSKSCTVNVPEY